MFLTVTLNYVILRQIELPSISLLRFSIIIKILKVATQHGLSLHIHGGELDQHKVETAGQVHGVWSILYFRF